MANGSLTQREVAIYEATPNAADVRVGTNGEDQAFQELCAGQIDLVDSARPISRAEWEACQAVGLDVVQFQVAAEAIVVAIKSETDVGADCLSTDQVRDIWRAGSPLTNWSQDPLNYDDVPCGSEAPTPPTRASRSSGATSWAPRALPGRPALRLLPRPVRRGRQAVRGGPAVMREARGALRRRLAPARPGRPGGPGRPPGAPGRP